MELDTAQPGIVFTLRVKCAARRAGHRAGFEKWLA